MNTTTRVGLVAGAALFVAALAGCSAGSHALSSPAGSAPGTSSATAPAVVAAPSTPSAAATTSPVVAPVTTATKAPATKAPAATTLPAKPAAPAAPQHATRPPQPAAPTRNASSVPGLVASIATASHPGLTTCDGQFLSLVAAATDLRGIGGTQYLVDTTCQGATGSTPDEVAIYQPVGGTLQRTAILYQQAAGVPRLTAYPYLDGPRTVVMTYADVSEWQLIHVGASSISFGPLEHS